MNNERQLLLKLASCPYLEPATMRKLVRRAGSVTAMYEGGDWFESLDDARIRDSVTRVRRWLYRPEQEQAHFEWLCEELGIRIITVHDEQYPDRFAALSDPPLVMFARSHGECPWTISTPTVGIVGTRRASTYGLEAARWVSESIVRAGAVVISGLALGIDAAAHHAALDAGGGTLAVLGCGADQCYPVSHQALYNRIIRSGGVWSEYAPGVPVAKYHFPERNRLIAALSDRLVVVQAGEQSGALVTVDHALQLGKDVAAVPGPIIGNMFRGSNRLIQAGASVVMDPVEWVNDQFSQDIAVSNASVVPERWRSLYDLIGQGSSAVALAAALAWAPERVYAGLLELELGGYVRKGFGGVYTTVR